VFHGSRREGEPSAGWMRPGQSVLLVIPVDQSGRGCTEAGEAAGAGLLKRSCSDSTKRGTRERLDRAANGRSMEQERSHDGQCVSICGGAISILIL